MTATDTRDHERDTPQPTGSGSPSLMSSQWTPEWHVRRDHTGATPLDPATPPRPPVRQRTVIGIGVAFLAASVALIAWMRLGLWLALLAIVLAWAVSWAAGWRGRSMRVLAFALAVFATSIDYIMWRTSVISWRAFYVGVPLFLAELHALVHNLGLQVGLLPRSEMPFADDLDPAGRPVFVFVPTVDEGVEIVRGTLLGVQEAAEHFRAQHPGARFEIVVCNDGGVAGAECSPAVEQLCHDMGVTCVTRAVGGGAKAGNVENARQLVGATGDCFIVIFDADQIPEPNFFDETLAPMRDATVGWVQSGQFYRNRDNVVARWADDQQSLFYRLLCPAKSAMDAAFICGTNVVLRGEALDEIGGFPTDSVTEDFAASILLAPRWRSVYVPGVLATGLGPVTMAAYLKQQERWARGTLTVLRTRWKEVFLPHRDGMPVAQRVQYALALTHYLCGVRDLTFLVTPILFILFGFNGVHGATMGQFFAHFVPYYLVAGVAFLYAANRTTSWRSVVIGFASMPVLLQATVKAFSGREGHFTLTPKRRTQENVVSTMMPFLVILAACLVAIVVGLFFKGGAMQWVAVAWLMYFVVLVLLILQLIWADAHPRPADRPGHAAVLARRLARTPRRLVAGVLALVVALGVIVALATRPGAVHPQGAAGLAEVPEHARVGFSDQGQSAPQLASDQQLAGRTFEISDAVDSGWLTRQADAHRVPWLNLVFTRRGRVELSSHLTAIANGVDDADLRRWAHGIARDGRPVYLTVLSEDDRNYGTSTAVAEGAVPADSARAWQHIRQVFAAEHATNVSWVWTPADPAHDAVYSPPADQVDAVALTAFGYPGTRWSDPATQVDAVTRRHPGKALLLDVATSGTDSTGMTRAQYLQRVAGAVRGRSSVAGVMYTLGGPVADTTSAAARAWSPVGDQDALTALATIATEAHR